MTMIGCVLIACSTATLCTGIDQEIPDRSLSTEIINAIKTQAAQKENLDQPIVITKVDKYMGKDNWHIVWATPENMDPGVFLLQAVANNLEYVAVWGGVAFPEEEPEVLKWFTTQAPTAPIPLLKCVAHFISTGKE